MQKYLTFERLRSVNLLRCRRWHPGGVDDWNLSDWGIAAAGEFGEAMNIIKKLNRERDGITGNSKSKIELLYDLADELADTIIYLDLLAARVDIDLSAAIVKKYNQTSVKVGFPERL